MINETRFELYDSKFDSINYRYKQLVDENKLIRKQNINVSEALTNLRKIFIDLYTETLSELEILLIRSEEINQEKSKDEKINFDCKSMHTRTPC